MDEQAIKPPFCDSCDSKGVRHKAVCPKASKSPQEGPEPQNGIEANVSHETPSQASVEPKEPTPEEIAAELAELEAMKQAGEEKKVAEMRPTNSIDLSMFSPEQLLALKDAIDKTGAVDQKKKKRTAEFEIRSVDGRLVIDFSNCFKREVFDSEQQRKVVRTHIKVKLEGDTFTSWAEAPEERTMVYRDFQQLPRIICEQVAVAEYPHEVELGEVKSAQYSKPGHDVFVPNVVKYVRRRFTLRKPDGTTFDIFDDKL